MTDLATVAAGAEAGRRAAWRQFYAERDAREVWEQRAALLARLIVAAEVTLAQFVALFTPDDLDGPAALSIRRAIGQLGSYGDVLHDFGLPREVEVAVNVADRLDAMREAITERDTRRTEPTPPDEARRRAGDLRASLKHRPEVPTP